MPKKHMGCETGVQKPARTGKRAPAKAGSRRRGRTARRGAGRPPLYKTARAMQRKIDEYFSAHTGRFPVLCAGKPVFDRHGKPVLEERPPTVAGLALFLGFADRSSLYEYMGRAEFADTIKKAVTRMEAYAESALLVKDKPTGSIFWLKNHGWTAQGRTAVTLAPPPDEEEMRRIMTERMDDPGADPADAAD